ncbi:MAG: PAS domain S-box protein [Terriglobia bacterium]
MAEIPALDNQILANAIIEFSEDAIIGKTLDGTILTWNSGAERLYGYAAPEVVGKAIRVLLPPDRHDEEDEILRKLGRGERVAHFETVRRHKNGLSIDVSLTISPIRNTNGTIIAASHVARDVTDKQRLNHQYRSLAAIVESSEDAIVSKTLDSVILTWNGGAERVYGYTAAEAIGQLMTLVLPEDRPDEESEIVRQIRSGERVDHFETVRRRKDGRLIHVSLTVSPVRDNHGQVVGASHSARDITERRNIEDQMRQTQKLESLGVLAGGVAHDFNNLLTGILGNATLAATHLSTANPAFHLLQDVVDASERAALLTRQLLAYAGKGRFVTEPVNLSELTREMSALVQISVSRNVQIRLELSDNLPLVVGDVSQLQQVIMNLVINASEAIGEQKNGAVLVTTGVEHVDSAYLRTLPNEDSLPPGDYVSLEVHDTGSGMDEATIARIFDPFFTTKFTGRGLGLAAVQGIVRGHKGLIRVYSSVGKGTTFKLLLPVSRDGRAILKPEEAQLLLRGDGQLVLVVDDEEIIRRAAKSMLETFGYTAVAADNGKEGVALFELLGEKVAVVLLDMTMPVMSGEDAFARMIAIHPEAKIILSSGYNEVEAIRRFTGKKLAAFLQKPYSAQKLAATIRSVLSA